MPGPHPNPNCPQNMRCACGRKSSVYYTVKNIVNGNTLQIGKCCIDVLRPKPSSTLNESNTAEEPSPPH
jgi:hypothetical protein